MGAASKLTFDNFKALEKHSQMSLAGEAALGLQLDVPMASKSIDANNESSKEPNRSSLSGVPPLVGCSSPGLSSSGSGEIFGREEVLEAAKNELMARTLHSRWRKVVVSSGLPDV